MSKLASFNTTIVWVRRFKDMYIAEDKEGFNTTIVWVRQLAIIKKIRRSLVSIQRLFGFVGLWRLFLVKE